MKDRHSSGWGHTSERGRRRWRPTVGHWLIFLMVAFLAGPLCLSNLWGYMQSRRYLTEAAFRNIRNVAALEAAETLEFVRAAENLVPSIIAGNEHLFSILRALDHESDAEAAASRSALRTHLAAKANEASPVEEFQVISPTGALLASSNGSAVAPRGRTTSLCYRGGRERQGVVGFDYGGVDERREGHDTTNAHRESAHDEPDLLVAAPIQDADGVLLGVFCARFAFDIHHSLLMAREERTTQANLYLLDKHGKVVCGSFADLHAAPYGERPASIPDSVARDRNAWEGRHRADSGREIMAAYAPIPSLDWGVVVEVPVVQALADLERLKWQALAASALLAVILGLAGFLGWRMVVSPLHALSQASDRMAFGAPGETVRPKGPLEVAELATAFNRMSLALKESQDTLELRIADRTRALRESQEFSDLPARFDRPARRRHRCELRDHQGERRRLPNARREPGGRSLLRSVRRHSGPVRG